jgi:hypothetical protein
MAKVADVFPAAKFERSLALHDGLEASDLLWMPTTIVAHTKLTPGAKLTYSKLIEYARGREVATNNRLAADLVVSPRSVRNYIAALRAAGLVEVRRHPGKPNSYRLTSANK